MDSADLIATELMRYEFERAEGAINWLVDERKEPWFPTWGEIHEALRYFTPKPIRQIEPAVTPPPPEFFAAKDKLDRSLNERKAYMVQTSGDGPKAWAKRIGPTIVLTNRAGSIVWDYTPTNDSRDRLELAYAAKQWNVPLATLERLASA